jgi:hypothetical protein
MRIARTTTKIFYKNETKPKPKEKQGKSYQRPHQYQPLMQRPKMKAQMKQRKNKSIKNRYRKSIS